MAAPVCGKAADAVLLGRVHGRGAGQAQNPQPEAKARSRVPVRVGVHLGAGSGDGYGRRGALGRSEKREAVAASSCDGLLHVHVCGPFLLPISRWGIDSSSSSDGPSGEVAGIEANKRRLTLDLASTLQPWLKVWRSRASACTGAVKPPSIGRPTKGEADTPFLGGAMRRERLPGDMLSVPG